MSRDVPGLLALTIVYQGFLRSGTTVRRVCGRTVGWEWNKDRAHALSQESSLIVASIAVFVGDGSSAFAAQETTDVDAGQDRHRSPRVGSSTRPTARACHQADGSRSSAATYPAIARQSRPSTDTEYVVAVVSSSMARTRELVVAAVTYRQAGCPPLGRFLTDDQVQALVVPTSRTAWERRPHRPPLPRSRAHPRAHPASPWRPCSPTPQASASSPLAAVDRRRPHRAWHAAAASHLHHGPGVAEGGGHRRLLRGGHGLHPVVGRRVAISWRVHAFGLSRPCSRPTSGASSVTWHRHQPCGWPPSSSVCRGAALAQQRRDLI